MKKLMIILILALVPSFVFATTTTATIGGTLKVYETLGIINVRDMIWPAQYAGTTAADLYTSTGLAAASGITGTNTIGQAGRAVVQGTGGTQFTPSLSAFTFTAGPGSYTAINAATTVAICSVEPIAVGVCAGGSVISGVQTLPSAGTPAQVTAFYIQGKIASGVAIAAGTYTGTTTFTATYN